jgi:hypothetical protein
MKTNINKDVSEKLKKAIDFISKLSEDQKQKIIKLLKEVQGIQKSELTIKEKSNEIKRVLWTEQSSKSKLLIGAFLGTIMGFALFGTGGIGIVALGGGLGIWGFFAGTAGGVLISSLIQNFENKEKNNY